MMMVFDGSLVVDIFMNNLFVGMDAETAQDVIVEATGCCGTRYEGGRIASLSWTDYELESYFFASVDDSGNIVAVYSRHESFEKD